jgi:DNA-binding Lrp family transcriptional regulator
MAKSSKERQIEDERKILAELQKNSNEKLETIAKRCGFSRQKAWRIIKQLEKSHKIWGYSTIIDNDEKGLHKFMLSLKRSNVPFDKKDFDDIAMTQLEDVWRDLGITMQHSYFINGEYDCIVIFTAKDLIDAKKFTDHLMLRYSKNTTKLQLNEILFTLREQCILNPNSMGIKEFL